MLRIYLLLKKYMVLIYLLVEETYDLNSLFIEEPPDPDIPTQVVKVNSLYRYDKAEIPFTKFASPCLDEFDKFMDKQEDFNAYFGRQLKYNSNMLEHLGDYMDNVKGELKLISKQCSYGYHSSRTST